MHLRYPQILRGTERHQATANLVTNTPLSSGAYKHEIPSHHAECGYLNFVCYPRKCFRRSIFSSGLPGTIIMEHPICARNLTGLPPNQDKLSHHVSITVVISVQGGYSPSSRPVHGIGSSGQFDTLEAKSSGA